MAAKVPSAFDDMGGEFEARLRRNTVATRSSRNEGRELTVSNPLAILEARFSYKVLDRLYFPSFIGIERNVNGSMRYVVYEVIGVNPTHYQLPGVDSSMPTLLRKEYLDTIKESWGKSQETWIDLSAIPTSYVAELDGNKLNFARAPHEPLPGAQAFLLSKDSVEKFLCLTSGEKIGSMAGFDLPFTVDMPNLIRYHCGFFAFTGSGKSNLASVLIRKALKADPDLTVVVFDIAGEYSVHLVDQLGENSKVITTEMIESAEQFCSSQAIPESLEEAVGRGNVEKGLAKVYRGGVERLSLQEAGGIDLGWIQTMFEGTVDGGKTGGTAAKLAIGKLTTDFYEKRRMRQSTKLTELDDESRKALITLLDDVKSNVSDRSGIFMESNQIIDMLHGAVEEPKETQSLTPEKLADQLAKGKAARLNILYLPDPVDARQTAHRLITRLLFLKKRYGNKQRVLVVLDEAQEYIPDNPTDKAYTYQSNNAVEQLLRQGRKYRLHCWMATQRVARLNVNALQQLHSYFVSTLPRMYDRMVIADAFGLPYEALERSAQLETGEWIFVSFKAAKQRNVPVFLKTDNNETLVAGYLK
ncbi:MAG: ATP-binding protein [Nitrososphaerales archaeon]|nr:ATP-binding protein [Nitrososphaerales archaeon]